MLKNFFLSEKKFAKCNFKSLSKDQVHENVSFLMKMNSFFAMQKTIFSWVFELILQKKSHFRA